jgi:hypothetical protein
MIMKEGRWIKARKKPSDYPDTEQQQKIAEAGRRISEECTGKKGKEFQLCRSEVLQEMFRPK